VTGATCLNARSLSYGSEAQTCEVTDIVGYPAGPNHGHYRVG
jgi:hypothetical protein